MYVSCLSLQKRSGTDLKVELQQYDVLGGYMSSAANGEFMGDTLPFGKWPFGKTYSYIGLGEFRTCALTTTGEVYCVGDCESQLSCRVRRGSN